MTASPHGRAIDFEIATATVATIKWPSHHDRRARVFDTGRAALLVVEPDHPSPPDLGPLEDWIRAPVDLVELEVRLEGLRHRQHRLRGGVHLDDDGKLHTSNRQVALSDLHRALVVPLLARIGQPVPQVHLQQASARAGTTVDRDGLRRALRRLAGRLADVGLDLHLLSGRAVLLEHPADDSSHGADRTRNLHETSTQDSDARPTRLN